MTENQKQMHVSAFFLAPLTSHCQEITTDDMQSLQEASEDCPPINVLLQLKLLPYVATKIWNAADELLKGYMQISGEYKRLGISSKKGR